MTHLKESIEAERKAIEFYTSQLAKHSDVMTPSTKRMFQRLASRHTKYLEDFMRIERREKK